MSIIPSIFCGGRSNVFDPLSLDKWDPFEDCPFLKKLVNIPNAAGESAPAASATARIDWKDTPEGHIFKADLQGLKKEEVKVEVQEGMVLQISGRGAGSRRRRTTSGIAWRGAVANSCAGSGCRRMPRWMRWRGVWRTVCSLWQCLKWRWRSLMSKALRFLAELNNVVSPCVFYVYKLMNNEWVKHECVFSAVVWSPNCA